MHHIPKAHDETLVSRAVRHLTDLIEKPVVWFRENVVLPNRQDYAWYHEEIRRVPTVDECYTDDWVCIYEADQQFLRDRAVDSHILKILRRRYENCNFYNRPDNQVCDPLFDTWQNAMTNFFIKYGDLGYGRRSIAAYMKQKHRMIWERRHGPVGTESEEEAKLRHKGIRRFLKGIIDV